VFDAGVCDDRPYLVMELLRGEDLGSRLRRDGRIPISEAIHLTAQILRGLARAHDAGIVHRDLKPDNVFLVEKDDGAAHVKIVDFGISKIAPSKSGTTPLVLTQRGIVLGTPLYMSPEQAQSMRDVDGRADLFSVGAVLFECVSGRPPYTGETYEQIIVSICMKDAPDLRAVAPSAPTELAAFVARALARDRASRFQSAREMLDALRAIAPSDPATSPIWTTKEKRGASGSGGVPTDVSWTAGARAVTTMDAPERTMVRRRGGGMLVATAVLATLAGTAITMGIVSATSGSHTAPSSSASTHAQAASAAPIATASTTAATSSAAPEDNTAFVPPASNAPATTETPSAPTSTTTPKTIATSAPPRATAPTTTATTTPAPKSTGLDIQRELP
jgi:serine/threonine-protein kinase